MLSRKPHLRDQKEKRTEYRKMGVRDYFRYAPKGNTMARRTGHRLEGDRMVEAGWKLLKRLGQERIRSEVLGLELRVKREE